MKRQLLLGELGPGVTAEPPKSLEEELNEAGLTMDDWDELLEEENNGRAC